MTDVLQQRAVAGIAESPALPLCVDLDGTLVKSDTLVDSVLLMVRQNPVALLQLPLWLVQGKAAFKAHIAKAVTLDAVHLPYNRPLLQFLEQQHAAGRPIYLATAADAKLAAGVAAHLGLFTATLASDGSTNLVGANKLAAFHAKFPQGGVCGWEAYVAVKCNGVSGITFRVGTRKVGRKVGLSRPRWRKPLARQNLLSGRWWRRELQDAPRRL